MTDKEFEGKIEKIITKYSKKEVSGELGKVFYIKDILEEIVPLIRSSQDEKTRAEIETKVNKYLLDNKIPISKDLYAILKLISGKIK